MYCVDGIKSTLEQGRKVWFFHINHTNPLLGEQSEESRQVLERGFNNAAAGIEPSP